MFFAGLDLGQRRDHTAIAVVERRETRGAYGTPEFESLAVRHLERVPLGTPYPRVVERVREILGHEELQGRCSLAVDGTGVGGPVVEMLRAARLGCEICSVTITGGARERKDGDRGGEAWSVPKRDLMAGVQVLLERGELRIARKLKEAGPLTRELLDVKYRQIESGRVRMGAEGCGEHDDLVIALALACWRAKKRSGGGGGGGRLPGI
jgi:hypothetical protein